MRQSSSSQAGHRGGPRRRALLIGLVATVTAAAVGVAGCADGDDGSTFTGSPLRIGISLSLTGNFADPGSAAKRGYELWAETVNGKGGLLGRKVELKIVDDGSDPDRAAAIYEDLITKDRVDLVLGPYSSKLTIPSSQVAAKHDYAFIEPAGGSPKVFEQGLGNLFFVQPAPVVEQGAVFANYVLSMPAAQRPKTAAYPALDDPFTQPIAEHRAQACSRRRASGPCTPRRTRRAPTSRRSWTGSSRRSRTSWWPRPRPRTAYATVRSWSQLQMGARVALHGQRCELTGRVPRQGRPGERQRHLQLRRLVPRLQRQRERAVRGGVPDEVRRVRRPTSTTPRSRRTRPACCSNWWPTRPARSTTPPSSTPCTPASGRRRSVTCPGTQAGRPRLVHPVPVDRRQTSVRLPARPRPARTHRPAAAVGRHPVRGLSVGSRLALVGPLAGVGVPVHVGHFHPEPVAGAGLATSAAGREAMC